MKNLVTVREYARLTTSLVESPTLDLAQVTQSAFDWLCELNASFTQAGAAIVQVQDRRLLKLDNYVGVVETPCGTRLEILPKHFEQDDCIRQSRALLCRMIQKSLKLPAREVGTANLERFDAPLSEWVMGRFLESLDQLIKRGLRFDYQQVEEERTFLRGQLNTAMQMRQPASRQHQFHIRHEVFLPDRAENRLLRTALDIVCKNAESPENWRLAHELRTIFQAVPYSKNVREDFKNWRQDRLMASYSSARLWCELIINQRTPLAVAGDWQGLSFLFPMERLFESYVASCLGDRLLPDATLHEQVSTHSLCSVEGRPIFRLKPDLVVEYGAKKWVLDTKWKRLDSSQASRNYGLSQSDIYQMFAYGDKCMRGEGDLILIYPRCFRFLERLPVFDYSPKMRLWVVPFDLDTMLLLGTEGAQLPLDDVLRTGDMNFSSYPA